MNRPGWRETRQGLVATALGPSPEVVDLHLKIVGPNVASADANAIEAHLRQNSGMDPDEYLHPVDVPRSDVAIDIPEVSSLYIEISTGCVSAADLPVLQQDLEEMAGALGVRR